MKETVIVAAKRTPFGSFCGSLSGFEGYELGAVAIKDLFTQSALDISKVERGYFGNVLQAGQGQSPGRQALLNAGGPSHADVATINKVCASGLLACCLGSNDIQLGQAEVVLVGGFESMSRARFLLPPIARSGLRFGNASLVDSMQHDGLTDAYDGNAMGTCSDFVAKKLEISRQEQDEYAALSYSRSKESQDKNLFASFMTAVEVPQRKGDPIQVIQDEEPARGKPERFASLRPAFGEEGTATAANSSTINDGGVALLLTSKEFADAHGIKPLARIRQHTWAGVSPREFPLAPIEATKKLLDAVGWDIGEIAIHEVNEAFASVAVAYSKSFSVPYDKINPLGGAVSLGHPIGASGARILTSALSAFEHGMGDKAILSICNGGGGAVAMALEKM